MDYHIGTVVSLGNAGYLSLLEILYALLIEILSKILIESNCNSLYLACSLDKYSNGSIVYLSILYYIIDEI